MENMANEHEVKQVNNYAIQRKKCVMRANLR